MRSLTISILAGSKTDTAPPTRARHEIVTVAMLCRTAHVVASARPDGQVAIPHPIAMGLISAPLEQQRRQVAFGISSLAAFARDGLNLSYETPPTCRLLLADRGELHAFLPGMLSRCRTEPGNLQWNGLRNTSTYERYVREELYCDAAVAESHRQAPDYRKIAALLLAARKGRS